MLIFLLVSVARQKPFFARYLFGIYRQEIVYTIIMLLHHFYVHNDFHFPIASQFSEVYMLTLQHFDEYRSITEGNNVIINLQVLSMIQFHSKHAILKTL